MVSEQTLERRPCCGLVILVGKYIVTLASLSIQGREMIGGGLLSTTGSIEGCVEVSSDSWIVMMSPEIGNWMVYGSESCVGTVTILASEAGKVG